MLRAIRDWWTWKARPDNANDRVRCVAEAIGDPKTFHDRARLAATELGSSSIETLVTLFHSEHTPPTETLKAQFPGLGQWISARQFAIFEMFYFFGSASLPVLRRVAYGPYDWTQGNAIEILCRLAADGLDRQRVVEELIAKMPDMREEALLYAAGPLLERSRSTPAVADILNELCAVPEFRDACSSLSKHEA